ncbi:hypothetical protein SDJN03_02727, partial [Cucurbita argyrosperma subsp. sororia]
MDRGILVLAFLVLQLSVSFESDDCGQFHSDDCGQFHSDANVEFESDTERYDLIKLSSPCSDRVTSMSIKLLVQEHFPGIIVTLSHYPPAQPILLLRNLYQLHKY